MEAIFKGIASKMMVMLSAISTKTKSRSNWSNFACIDSVSDNLTYLRPFRIFYTCPFALFYCCLFTFFGLIISFSGNFTFESLVMFSYSCSAFFVIVALIVTRFAVMLKSIFPCAVFVKLRQHFNSLAFATSFRYDSLRHLLFLNKSLCSGLVAAHTAVSLLYSTPNQIHVNTFFRNFQNVR